jgi:multidrug efflux system outer membrane protein
MKSQIKYIGIVSIVISIMYSSCKTPDTSLNKVKNSLPQTFSESNDSTNSADINWKNFFDDKNLISLIDTALQNNYDVLMTLQKIEIARNDLRLTRGAMLPTVNSNIAYLQRKFGYYTMDDAGNRTTEITPGKMVPTILPDYFVGFQTNWEIDIWAKLRNKKKAAFSRYLSSVEGTNLVLTNLISEIANTYYELISLDNELNIIRESIKLQNDALEIIKIQKDEAILNELAVKQFEAQVLKSQSLEYETLYKITEKENKLNFLLGRFPQQIVREKSFQTNQLTEKIKTGIPSQLLNNRPDIRQTELNLVATEFDVKTAKSAFYPSFTITGNFGFQSFNTSFLFNSPQSIAYNLLGGLTTPLINRSSLKAQFNNAKASQIEAMYMYQKTILNAFLEVSTGISNLKNLEQMEQLKIKEAETNTRAVEIADQLFKSGKANYFEVLMVQNGYLQSKLELINTQKLQQNESINIYKALGGGWR